MVAQILAPFLLPPWRGKGQEALRRRSRAKAGMRGSSMVGSLLGLALCLSGCSPGGTRAACRRRPPPVRRWSSRRWTTCCDCTARPS